jgi:hypothetical protein
MRRVSTDPKFNPRIQIFTERGQLGVSGTRWIGGGARQPDDVHSMCIRRLDDIRGRGLRAEQNALCAFDRKERVRHEHAQLVFLSR